MGLYDGIGFDWKRLAGATVAEVEGKKAYGDVDHLAAIQVGNHLDHGICVNSVFTGYIVACSNWSRKLFPFTSQQFPDQGNLTTEVVPVGSDKTDDQDSVLRRLSQLHSRIRPLCGCRSPQDICRLPEIP